MVAEQCLVEVKAGRQAVARRCSKEIHKLYYVKLWGWQIWQVPRHISCTFLLISSLSLIRFIKQIAQVKAVVQEIFGFLDSEHIRILDKIVFVL